MIRLGGICLAIAARESLHLARISEVVMIFGKIIDDNLVYAPKTLVVNGVRYYNPKPERYIREGWFPVEDNFPENEPEPGYYFSPNGWELSENKIVRKYELVKAESEETE